MVKDGCPATLCNRGALRGATLSPSLLIGHSLGGVPATAPHVPDATAVVSIGAAASAAHVTHTFAGVLADIVEKGTAEVTLAGRTFTISRRFLDGPTGQNFLNELGTMRKALLVWHAPQDEYVGIENATAIFAAARHPKSFLSLHTADYLLRKRSAGIYVADVTRSGRFLQGVRGGRHQMVADEPVAADGNDAGPDPYVHLLAALGACISMTMRLYAERKLLNTPLAPQDPRGGLCGLRYQGRQHRRDYPRHDHRG
jgi:fermentation-respiration switch protein FrsA (DUF1100 family)